MVYTFKNGLLKAVKSKNIHLKGNIFVYYWLTSFFSQCIQI